MLPGADEGGGSKPDYLRLLERYGGRRGQRAVAIAAAVQVAMPAVKWAKEKLEREDYSVSVYSTDDIYFPLHEWVLSHMTPAEQKALIATTEYRRRTYAGHGERPRARVRLRYDGSVEQEITLDGHRIKIEVERDRPPSGAGGSEDISSASMLHTEKLKMTSRDEGGRDAIARVIKQLLDALHGEEGTPPLFIPSRWGGEWVKRRDLPPRTINSVILKSGQLERLCADLRAFLGAEDDYNRLSQPWHRGYLFHGAPGTGKTSVARALANEFGLPTYYLPLGDIDKDTDLMNFVSEIEPRSMLLIEDVDVYGAATDRDEEKTRASLAAMLNALDGVWTPHGLITVMTTNYRERLDEALLRAGRVDVEEEFTLLDGEQAQRLAEYFEYDGAECYAGESPAQMIEAMRA